MIFFLFLGQGMLEISILEITKNENNKLKKVADEQNRL